MTAEACVRRRLVTLLLLSLLLVSGHALAQMQGGRSTGQSLYLPVYSHIWHGDAERSGQPMKTLVSVLVSIRNTDPKRSVRLVSARYYDTAGKAIKEYVAAPRVLGPMSTYEIFVPRGDDTGGSGANFVIDWKSDAPASPPLVEAVHANLPGGRSISFVTTARAIPPE